MSKINRFGLALACFGLGNMFAATQESSYWISFILISVGLGIICTWSDYG